MSEQKPDQTAIFTVVPTSEVPRYLELLEGASGPPSAIDTIELPAERNEAARVLGRLVGEGDHHIEVQRVVSIGYAVTPHETRPTSLIENVVSGEVVEAITKENLQQVSRMYRGRPNVGGRLASLLRMDSPPYPEWTHWTDPYMVRYQPKRTLRQAIRVESAPDVLDVLVDPPPRLWIADSHVELFTHVCEMIEAHPDET